MWHYDCVCRNNDDGENIDISVKKMIQELFYDFDNFAVLYELDEDINDGKPMLIEYGSIEQIDSFLRGFDFHNALIGSSYPRRDNMVRGLLYIDELEDLNQYFETNCFSAVDVAWGNEIADDDYDDYDDCYYDDYDDYDDDYYEN